MPFGGFKQSGNGLESGYQGIAEYLQVKTTAIKLQYHARDRIKRLLANQVNSKNATYNKDNPTTLEPDRCTLQFGKFQEDACGMHRCRWPYSQLVKCCRHLPNKVIFAIQDSIALSSLTGINMTSFALHLSDLLLQCCSRLHECFGKDPRIQASRPQPLLCWCRFVYPIHIFPKPGSHPGSNVPIFHNSQLSRGYRAIHEFFNTNDTLLKLT